MDLKNLDFEAVNREMEIDKASQSVAVVPESNALSKAGHGSKGIDPKVVGGNEAAT